jgi:FkbM family methyltransferase
MLLYRANKSNYIGLTGGAHKVTRNVNISGLCNLYEVGDGAEKYPYNQIVRMYVPKNDMYIQETLKKGYLFEKYVTMAIFAFCEKGSLVFDVGANFGSVTLPCAKWFNVHSFEPFEMTGRILEENVRVNKLEKNVTIHNVAVGHTNMITRLSSKIKLMDHYTKEMTEQNIIVDRNSDPESSKSDNSDSESSKYESVNYGGIQLGDDGQPIDMITLDGLMDTVDRVSLIKVDVEGAEPLVFYGARKIIKRDMPIIIFEKNWQKITDEMIVSMKLPDNVVDFDIFKYCHEIGYRKILHLRSDDYVLIPPNRERLLFDPMFRTKPINPNDPIDREFVGFEIHKLEKIKWS